MTITAYALSNNSIIPLSTDNPDQPNAAIPIVGLDIGETLVGIDVRPQNGKLYGLTSNGSGGVRLYVISPQTGVATALTAAPVQFTDSNGNAVPIRGTNFGIDFNPTVDRLRIVTDAGENFRLNPNTGTLIDGNNGGADTPGINPDGAVSGSATTVDATAYTNNTPNATATTQYTLDASTNSLLIQNPPNNGVQTERRTITLNGNPLDFTAVNGFDIPAGVNVSASNTVAAGRGFAALTVGGSTGLYAIELSTGTATLIGPIGTGTAPVQGFATQSALIGNGTPVIGLSGTNLVRFNSALPATAATEGIVAITGVPTGETLVGIDFRPATGQLFGFSVNDTTNTGTLLILDPQTGVATSVGTPGQVALVDGNGSPVDLPASGYGFDFNPTVDRIRVVTSSGLNFRLNPLTGAAVDGDNGGTAGSVAGINPDGAVKGATTSVDATAYTNSFSQLTGATITTQYTLDAATNSLLIQNPPNSGTQTSQLAVTLNGAPLNFDAVNGFDIPANVRAAASNVPVTGRGFAALQVGSSTNLYAIELSTGAATLIGPVGTGATPLAGLAVGDAPAGSIGFREATYTVSEDGGTIDLNLVRADGSTGALTVSLAATAGTANNSDFTGAPVVVTFADGQTTATATISITDDDVAEPTETVTFALSNPTNGAVLSAQNTAILTITDDEPIRGTSRNETLRGTPGNDLLLGLGGNDRLLGLEGDDTLDGGAGRDRLVGGAGADRFVYSGRNQRAAFSQSQLILRSRDRIVDFNFDQGDRILLDFDNNLSSRNRPRRLFNAGEQDADNLRLAARAAYADKNQRQRGDQSLQANEAVFFRLGSRTFLSVNDGEEAFSNTNDLLINVTGIDFRGNDANRGSLRVANYFA